MQFRRDDDGGEVEIQLTSFMDIAFLLLIFFLVTASLRKPHKELDIQLPTAEHAKIAKLQKEELVISIDQQGRISLNNDVNITQQELTKRLGQTAPDTHIRIDVDRRVQVFRLAEVMDLCQLYNLRNIGVRTKE